MSERVLHEWTDSESIIRIVEDDRGFFGWSAESGIVTDLIPTVFCRELARLAVENAKLRKCVEAADSEINAWREWGARISGDERVCGWVHQEDYGLYCLLADPPVSGIPYDAARAEVDK